MNRYINMKICVLALFISASAPAYAQDVFTVRGAVRSLSGEALPQAAVAIEETRTGIVTKSDGSFEIEAVAGNTLIISYPGYVTRKYSVAAPVTLDIVLDEDVRQLQDVVVFGYGSMEKKDLTGAIQSIDNRELVKSMTVNVTEALNGRISGVLVNKTSNRPGSSMSVQIRGLNSFNFTNEPLYVIDGVPSYSGMKHLNSADIESIDVLKDASSSAIYGSRGANGVVIVTTKGATMRQGFSVEYSGYAGIKTPVRIPDMIGNKGNGMEYVDYKIALWKKKYGESSLMRDDFLTTDEKRRVKYGEYYDWLREISGQALVTSHHINASGGSDKVSYTFGVGYLRDDGMVGNESFQRITGNVGLEYRMSDRFKIGMSSYVSFDNTNHGADEALLNAYFIPPVASPYGNDGELAFEVQPTSSKINPFYQIENSTKETVARYTNFSGFLEFRPVKDLSVKSQIAVQYDNAVYGEWTGTYTQAKQGVSLPDAYRREGANMNWVWDNVATYDKTFNGNHHLNAVGLFSMQKDTHQSSEMRGEGLPYDSDWHAIQTADQITGVQSNSWASSMVSVMGRVNYTFKDRYLFTATGRYDGSSRLAPGNQWGFMPSFAVGWRLAEEAFMKDVRWLNELKFRVSWGKSGNNSIDYDVTMSKLDLLKYTFGTNGQNGFGISDVKGNPDLKWEMTSEWNYGLDISVLNNRISATIDIYSRLTEDLIFKRSVAGVNGYTSILENIGSVTNRGIEIGINSVNISTGNFSWRTNAVFSLNRNKIRELYGTGEDDLANRWFIGQPINVIYDYEMLGVWQEEEKAEAARYGQAPGHIKVKDQDDNGVMDERDYIILGTPSPDWTAGMTNTFRYKQWDLSVYMYVRYGGLYGDEFTYMFTAWDNEHWNKLDVNYWTPENRSNEYPEVGAQSLYTQVLSKIPGTFLKIQNITLGYNFPEYWSRKLNIQSARVYFSVQNPFTFTAFKGPDPETIGENVSTQLSLYPMTFYLGLNFSF